MLQQQGAQPEGCTFHHIFRCKNLYGMQRWLRLAGLAITTSDRSCLQRSCLERQLSLGCHYMMKQVASSTAY